MIPTTRIVSSSSRVRAIRPVSEAVPRAINLLFALVLLCLSAQAQPRRVVAIAHRGEHLHHPENTIPAFQEAIRLGADFIEVDVRTTADGRWSKEIQALNP